VVLEFSFLHYRPAEGLTFWSICRASVQFVGYLFLKVNMEIEIK